MDPMGYGNGVHDFHHVIFSYSLGAFKCLKAMGQVVAGSTHAGDLCPSALFDSNQKSSVEDVAWWLFREFSPNLCKNADHKLGQ